MYISAISGSCWLFLLCSSSPAALRMGAKYTHTEKERERIMRCSFCNRAILLTKKSTSDVCWFLPSRVKKFTQKFSSTKKERKKESRMATPTTGGGGGGGEQQKQHTPQHKQTVLDLGKYIDKGVRVKLSGGREVEGILKGFDQLLNLVLDETKEYLRDVDDPLRITDETRKLGLIVTRGTSVMVVSPLDGLKEIENPFAAAEEY